MDGPSLDIRRPSPSVRICAINPFIHLAFSPFRARKGRPLGTEQGGRAQKVEKKPFRFAEREREGKRPFCPECHATSFVIDLSIGETRLLTVDHRQTLYAALHPLELSSLLTLFG